MSKPITPRGTFLDEEQNPSFDSSDAAFFGVEFDFTSTYGTGARFAPKAILDASRQIEFEVPFIGIRLDSKIKIHNLGMLHYKNPKSLKEVKLLSEKMVSQAKILASKALGAGKFLFVLGGDHSVSNGAIQAISEKFDSKDVCVVCFDAHLDLREAYEGMPLSHASISRRVNDAGFNQVFIGQRDSISGEEAKFISKEGGGLAGNIFYCPLLPRAFYEGKENRSWALKENILFDAKPTKTQMESILSKITQKNVWIELDIDVLDANEFLGTGTPMPGGMRLAVLNEILFEIISHAKKNEKRVLGFSLTEVLPVDVSNAFEMNAALLCYNMLVYNFMERFE